MAMRRTNITFYSGVRIPDAYRLGEVDGGIKIMQASLEMEHGGAGFLMHQESMLEAALEWAESPRRGNRRPIDDEETQTRLAKVRANVEASTVIGYRSVWAAAAGKARQGPYGPMAKMFTSEKFLEDSNDLLDLMAPDSLAKRNGPAGYMNLAARHSAADNDLWRHQRGPSQHDR